MKNIIKRLVNSIFVSAVSASVLFCAQSAKASDVIAEVSPNNKLSLTVYNDNKVLVKDVRNVELKKGRNKVVVTNAPFKMKADTLAISGKDIDVVEQHLDAGWKTINTIKEGLIGKEITVMRTNPATGKTSSEKVKVVNAYGDLIVERKGMLEKINENSPYVTVLYPSSSVGSNAGKDVGRNVLNATIDANKAGDRNIELTYLTDGISWGNSYAVKLSDDSNTASISGWVVLKNHSGADFENADITLSSDSITNVLKNSGAKTGGCSKCKSCASKKRAAQKAKKSVAVTGGLNGACGLTLRHPVTIKAGQTKQIALLSKYDISLTKEFRIQNPVMVYENGVNGFAKTNAKVWVSFENSADNTLAGGVYPAGDMYIYRDKGNGVEYVEERALPTVSDGSKIHLVHSKADEITYTGKRTSFRPAEDKKSYVNSYEVTINNASKKNADVLIEQHFPRRWKIVSESDKHKRKNSSIAKWNVKVPAKGSKTLKFKVEVKK
ncbi:MAG: DUF4139 domain-containing protein [Alphaproteobacteria bacterium]|nr:DUF4139 domain-containing protein [Alphaproteobacteria bacterium]